MAKNGPKGGGRRGAIRNRTQFRGPNGNWIKRDAKTGRILNQKADSSPFKSVTRER